MRWEGYQIPLSASAPPLLENLAWRDECSMLVALCVPGGGFDFQIGKGLLRGGPEVESLRSEV
jgi:hypothetical protein